MEDLDALSSFEATAAITLFTVSVAGGLAVKHKLMEYGISRRLAVAGGIGTSALVLAVSPYIVDEVSRPQNRQKFANFVDGID